MNTILLTLLFPGIAFAAKPENLTDRVGATIVMVLLAAAILCVWRMIKYMLDKRNNKIIHAHHVDHSSASEYTGSASYLVSSVQTTSAGIASTHATKDTDAQERVSRGTLSLEEALWGHWVSYIDYKTSLEKLTRSKHYVATHWYIDKENLSIIQVEIKGAKQIPMAKRNFIFNILEKNEREDMIRFEIFDGPQKLSYSQGTSKLSRDRYRIIHKTILPEISQLTTEWIYVDSMRKP